VIIWTQNPCEIIRFLILNVLFAVGEACEKKAKLRDFGRSFSLHFLPGITC
jgi:hypothetical protein